MNTIKKALKKATLFGLAFMLLFPLLGLIPKEAGAARRACDYRFVSAKNPPRVMQAGEKATAEVKVKNTGRASWYRSGNWRRRHMVYLAASHPKYRKSSFGFRRVRMVESKVRSGQIATFRFRMTAPKRGGNYNERFQLVANGRYWLRDVGMRFRVSVLGRASKVKVGITYGRSRTNRSGNITITSSGRYYIRDSRNRVLKTCNGGDISKVGIRGNKYYLYHQGRLFKKTRYYPIFIPLGGSILSVPSYRGSGYNVNGDRKFRDRIIVRYSRYGDRYAPPALWVINQIDVEKYCKGLAEEPESSHFNGLKTTAIVARTYALRNVAYPKSICRKRGFHLFNDVKSQVYKGYEYERRAPRLRQAVDSTRGIVVTYRGKPIVAAYHSRCGGRTRSLSKYPYLKGKKDKSPHVSGSRLGHGYGMCMAGMRVKAKAGWSASRIIYYYYTGVSVRRLY